MIYKKYAFFSALSFIAISFTFCNVRDNKSYWNKTIKPEVEIINNKISGIVKSYYPSGKLQATINFSNGIRHGSTIVYHENGKLLRKFNFSNGKEDGLLQEYDSNGIIIKQCYYKNGKLEDKCELFDSLGRQEVINYYSEGMFIKAQRFNEHGKVITESMDVQYKIIGFSETLDTLIVGKKYTIEIKVLNPYNDGMVLMIGNLNSNFVLIDTLKKYGLESTYAVQHTFRVEKEGKGEISGEIFDIRLNLNEKEIVQTKPFIYNYTGIKGKD